MTLEMENKNILLALAVWGCAAVAGILIGSTPSVSTLGYLLMIPFGLLILFKPRLGLYTMMFLIPLQNLAVFSGSSGNVTLVRVVGTVVFAAWLLRKMVLHESFRHLFSARIFKIAGLFVWILLISAAWSDFDLWLTPFFSYIQLLAWTLMLIDLIDSRDRLKELILVFLAGTLFSLVFAYTEFQVNEVGQLIYERVDGSLGDANTTASIYLFVMPFLIVFLRSDQFSRIWKAGILLIFLLLILGIGATVSRSGVVSLALLALLQLLELQKPTSRLKYVIISLVVIILIYPLVPLDNISYRFSLLSSGDLGGRAWIYRDAIDLFTASPLIGGGLGTHVGEVVISSHNAFLSVAIALGLAGLIPFIALWVLTWFQLSRAKQEARTRGNAEMMAYASAARIGLVIFLFFSFTMSTELQRMLWLYFALGEIINRLTFETKAGAVKPSQFIYSKNMRLQSDL
ncbi:MAG: O-antigen ligase family protein [Anaerolineae bacterium]|nr:O-antigen ligase family protein [Anaerolineae bacterium]